MATTDPQRHRKLPTEPFPGLEPLPRRSGRGADPVPAADATSLLFDAALYHYDPVSRCGLPYDLMGACSCGGTKFVLVMRGEDTRCHVICQACYGDWRYRLKRPDDVTYGNLDVRTKRVTYNRPMGELIATRARLGSKRS